MTTDTDLPSTDLTAGECHHEPSFRGRIGVLACADCGLLEFFGPSGPIDHAEGMAALYGTYDLIGALPAVGAPARHVLSYRPARGRGSALRLLPESVWLRAGPELWLASDGRTLLLATPNETMVRNLTRQPGQADSITDPGPRNWVS